MAYSQPFPLAQPQPVQKSSFGPDLSVRLICPECRDPTPNIREEFGSGDLVCGNCGLVLGDRIVDTRSEWRTFANDEGDDPSRVGAAIDPLDGIENLDTMISFKDGGSGIARELQRAAARSINARSERNLMTAFRQISTLCDAYSLPKTINDIAKQLYKRSEEEKLLRGKAQESVVAACMLIACRQAHVPRTFKEICQLTGVKKKVLGQCYKALEQAFNLAAPSGQVNGATAAPGTSAEDLLIRYCNHLNLPAYVQPICEEVVKAARKNGVGAGRSPVSIAGGAIYFTCYLLGHSRLAKEVSTVAGVSDGTIKLVYKQLLSYKEKLVKKEWVDSGKADMKRLPTDNIDQK